jgi:tRNA(Ile)-lysidine synthase
MASLGPFEPRPKIAVAVSGGSDSLALALLVKDWVAQRGGYAVAIVIDHGLRPTSAAEAGLTLTRLAAMGLSAELIRLDLGAGPALAERARHARYAALRAACTRSGHLHLGLGHHAADQAETVLMRVLSNSGPSGLAGMSALSEAEGVRLLRPLLEISPARLRATLAVAGIEWVDDPSNRDMRALRPRLRALRCDRAGDGPATQALVAAARASGQARAADEFEIARALSTAASIRPEGFAILRPGPLNPAALAALIGAIGGAAYPPSTQRLAALARSPRPATFGGVRLLPAGRLGPGLLLVREESQISAPCPAIPGQVWDGRFRLAAWARVPAGLSITALGHSASRFRRSTDLPAAVLRTLPALRDANNLFAVPHIGYPDAERCARAPLIFCPSNPVAGAPFVTAV